ncbi:hypothetical protein ACFVSU_03200 [Microbacterium sp. NPDC058062]|uniref:hypothetical protein n=1 Tax=Microbacterium sp. NPDC058062 TaxID=3346320 RepID=UPI0036DF5587
MASMDVPANGSDTDGELAELRRRAYGPHPDIHDDPAALARLIELETGQQRSGRPVEPAAASVAEVPETTPTVTATLTEEQPPPPPPPLQTPRSAPTRRWGLIALAVGAMVATTGVLATVVMSWDPPPDAVLHPTGTAADEELLTLLKAEGQPFSANDGGASEMEIDLSTLRSFGTYMEVEVWSAVNAFGSPCLIGIHRATEDVVARQCMPAGTDLSMDMYWDVQHGDGVRRALPEGEVLRFLWRADSVDVHVLLSEGTGS